MREHLFGDSLTAARIVAGFRLSCCLCPQLLCPGTRGDVHARRRTTRGTGLRIKQSACDRKEAWRSKGCPLKLDKGKDANMTSRQPRYTVRLQVLVRLVLQTHPAAMPLSIPGIKSAGSRRPCVP